MNVIKTRIIYNISKLSYEVSKNRKSLFNKVPVLCYHRILQGFENDNPHVPNISPYKFESQMAYLAANGYCSLNLKEYLEIASGVRKLQGPSVLVTIDDGYADSSIIGLPIAKRYGIKIVIFLITNLIGKSTPFPFPNKSPHVIEHIQRYPELWCSLTWPDIKSMISADVSFGIHGHTHQNIANLNKGAFIEDIESSIKLFKKEIGMLPFAFAIPYGNPRSYTAKTLNFIKEEGIQLIFCTQTGSSHLPTDKLPLPRLIISEDDDLEVFKLKLLGGYDWIQRVKCTEHSIWEIYSLVKNSLRNS